MTDNLLQSIGEFWQAMGGKPKATLHYAVTISVDVGEPVPAGSPVTDHKVLVFSHHKE